MLTKQKFIKETVAKIKTNHSKDMWPVLIQAAKETAKTLDDPAVIPCHVETDDADLERAKGILVSSDNYITRYLRLAPTVGLARKQPRNADGAIIVDAPAKLQKVICDGVPYACMIAFLDEDQLKIGWSRRIDTKSFVESDELNAMFKQVMEEVSEASSGFEHLFNSFCGKLTKFMSCQQPKETEVPFSKAAGRQAAIIRGLKDSIDINGKYAVSASSGPIPSDIAKNLTWFITNAEEAYGITASNVGHSDSLPTKAESSAVAVA